MKFLIVGSGYTGQRVLDALPEAIAVGRRNPPAGRRQYLQRNLDDGHLERVNVAGQYSLLYTVPPSTEHLSDKRLLNLLNSLSAPPQRIVYLSTSGVYGDRDGAITDEQVLPAPSTDRASRRWEAEKILLRYSANTDGSSVILRVPGIYGPGRLGLDRIASATPVIRDEDAKPGNRIHVDDLVRCCIAALQPQAISGVLNVGDGDHRSATWFSACVARHSGQLAPPQISREEAERTFRPRRLSFLKEARRLDTTRMRESLGVEPVYGDPEEGIKASLQADGLLVQPSAPEPASDQG